MDGTLGGGGYPRRSGAAPDGHAGGDRSGPGGAQAARDRLGEAGGTPPHLVHGAYGDLAEILRGLGIERVHGILLDLGVSSPQPGCGRARLLVREGRTTRHADGSDARSDRAGAPARAGCGGARGGDLRRWARRRYAKKIARLVKEAVRVDRVKTTTDPSGARRAGDPAGGAAEIEDSPGDLHVPGAADRGQRRGNRAAGGAARAVPGAAGAGGGARSSASTRSRIDWSRTGSGIWRGRRRCRRLAEQAGERDGAGLHAGDAAADLRGGRRGGAQTARPVGAAAGLRVDGGAERAGGPDEIWPED